MLASADDIARFKVASGEWREIAWLDEDGRLVARPLAVMCRLSKRLAAGGVISVRVDVDTAVALLTPSQELST